MERDLLTMMGLQPCLGPGTSGTGHAGDRDRERQAGERPTYRSERGCEGGQQPPPSKPNALAHRAPDVDHTSFLPTSRDRAIEAPTCADAEDEDLTLGEHPIERDESGVRHVRVRAQHGCTRPGQQLPELVRQRCARVVRLGLEGHAEDSDRPTLE